MHFNFFGLKVPRRSAEGDYLSMNAWWYVSRARAMMQDDAYRARALASTVYRWLASYTSSTNSTHKGQTDRFRLAVTTR